MEEEVYKPLKLSYDSLPDYQYQQCFLYCSLFPEDHLQKRDSLIEYLIGEGLVGELDSRQAELDLGNAIIKGLIDASLLEVTTGYFRRRYVVGDIKMHDVVRDMAKIVIRENFKAEENLKAQAQEGLKLQNQSKETERCVNIKSVFVMDFSEFESDVHNLPPNASKLTTLSFYRYFSSELPSPFFANMQNLVVLDMSGMSYLMLLPDSISYLENLRVLRLHGCVELKYIPSLAELKNLRYMDFSHTRLKEISKGMEGLTNLRVLKMLSVNFLDAFFPGALLKKLSNLQILEIDNAEVEAEVIISLKKLETLTIVFYNLESLNSYFKSGHWKRLQQYFIGYFQKKEFRKAEMWKEGNEHEKVLVIEEVGDFRGGKGETDMLFPNNVQKLVLGSWNGPMVDVVKNSAFLNLRELVIEFWEDIRHVFTPASVQEVLHNVEELSIYKGDHVEEIISGEEELVGGINNYYYPTTHLPRLKHLKLSVLMNLRSIYKGRMVCPSLQRIGIWFCGEIERLPFCMKKRNNLLLIQLRLFDMQKKWWDSLHWDDPHAKSFYQVEEIKTLLCSMEIEDDDPTEEDGLT